MLTFNLLVIIAAPFHKGKLVFTLEDDFSAKNYIS